jgi:hypothetical protein
MPVSGTARLFRGSALATLGAGLGILLGACASRPEIRTQTAPQFNLTSYHSYAFVPKPSTDTEGYRSITTQSIERAVAREMQALGYTQAPPGQQPDLLINFSIKTHDKVESRPGPTVGVGYGWGWGHYGWGGLGNYYDDIQTVTDGSLTIDVVDRAHNEAVWSGTAIGRLSKKIEANPGPAIDTAVNDIFAHYPAKTLAQAH